MSIIGVLLGVALALGFAGFRGQHWAVRVLSLVVAIVGIAAALVFGLFSGAKSGAWSAALGAALSFALVSVALVSAWVVTWWQAGRRGAALGALVLIAAVGVAWSIKAFRNAADPVPVAMQSEKSGAGMPAVVNAQKCACSDGAQCTGPRGGQYCVTDKGAKRYL